MTLRTILRYQLGDAGAIREVAGDRSALRVGVILVVTAAIARNYDQTFILERPYWPIGPLVFTFFSGLVIYWVVYPLCFKAAEGRHGFARPT